MNTIKMANKLENVVQHALRTFRRSNKKLPEPSQNDWAALKTLADDITLRDLKLPKFLLQKSGVHEFLDKTFKAKIDPIEYLRMYEDGDVSIGVFVLRQGAKLPIHDHPCMYGILKVLQGMIKVTNYSLVELDTSVSMKSSSFYYQHPLKVIKHPVSTISEKDGCCTLTPTERGIHEVECISGPAAFLDILAPPYEDDSFSTPRGCHYFQELEEDEGSDGYIRLVQIANPNYWVEEKESVHSSE